MTMHSNAQKAFDELKALGVSVFDWGEEEGYGEHVAFVMVWANDDKTEVFADRSGKYIREEYVDGRYINPLGYRQDVHEILKKYSLVSDWDNPGQIVIYNDPDAPGFHHAKEK